MLKSALFWFSFLASAFLFSSYANKIVWLLNSFGRLANPLLSSEVAIHYSWLILPLILAMATFPLLVRRIALVLVSRSLSAPNYGALTILLLLSFTAIALDTYVPPLVPALQPLSFGASVFQPWLPIPMLLAYIACEISSLMSRNSSSDGRVVLFDNRLSPNHGARGMFFLVVTLTWVLGHATDALGASTGKPTMTGIYGLLQLAILSLAGIYVCAAFAEYRPRLTVSLLSICLGATLFFFAQAPASKLLAQFLSSLLESLTNNRSLAGFTATLGSLILEILFAAGLYAASALAINRLTEQIPQPGDAAGSGHPDRASAIKSWLQGRLVGPFSAPPRNNHECTSNLWPRSG